MLSPSVPACPVLWIVVARVGLPSLHPPKHFPSVPSNLHGEWQFVALSSLCGECQFVAFQASMGKALQRSLMSSRLMMLLPSLSMCELQRQNPLPHLLLPPRLDLLVMLCVLRNPAPQTLGIRQCDDNDPLLPAMLSCQMPEGQFVGFEPHLACKSKVCMCSRAGLVEV